MIVVGAAHLPGGAPPTKEHIKGVIRGMTAHRQAAVDLYADPRARTAGERDMAERVVDLHRQRRVVGADVGGRSARPGLRACRSTHGRLVRWASSGRQSLLQRSRRPEYQDRQDGVALPDDPSRHLGFGTCRAPRFWRTSPWTVGRSRPWAAPTKQNYLYVFDRVTGKPVWPINEMPAPKGEMPGERYSPTQPIPSKPPAFGMQGISKDDLLDFTPELRAKAEAFVKNYHIGGLFEPPSAVDPNGTKGTLQVPGSQGGPNWPGGSFDPETGVVYIYAKTEVSLVAMVHEPKRSNMDYINGGGSEGATRIVVDNLPIVKPPWGRISAIDLNKGEILWQTAHGETADEVKNHPALKGVTIPRTGRTGHVGVLATKTLVMAGDGGMATHPNGQRSGMFRAYDKKTGQELAAVPIPGPQTGSPMTYLHGGKQYIVLAVSGQGASAELIALTLPDSN